LPYDLVEKITIGPLSKYIDSFHTLNISNENITVKKSSGYGIKRY